MLLDYVSKLKSSLEGNDNETNIAWHLLVIGLAICIAVNWWFTSRKYNLPPGPIGLPILGYLPFLGKDTHIDFDRLSKKYGNVFGLHLGNTYMVVLGDYETVKVTLNQNAALGRPESNFDFCPDGRGFASVNSTTEWTEQRRFAVRAMRNIGMGGSKWETLIQEEIDDIMKTIRESNGEATDHSKLFSESTSNNIMILVFGKRFPPGHPARKLLDRVVELDAEALDLTSLRNYFPAVADFLAKLGFGNQSKDLHSTFAEFTKLLKKEVDIRKKVYKNEDSDLLVDGYLKEIETNIKDNLNNTFNERNLRGTILSLLDTGIDATTAALMWLLLAMVQSPEIQDKVHQELDAVLGKSGIAQYSERSKLPYTYAAVQEVLRWVTIIPLSVVRMALEDTTINGYDIPKGTLIIPNLYAIHQDQTYWKEPEKFIPERFLNDDGLLNASKMDGYVPFSYGKRNCPGQTVVTITIFLYFATIMQRFKVLSPVGKTPKLEAIPGITYRPVHQELRFIPRE